MLWNRKILAMNNLPNKMRCVFLFLFTTIFVASPLLSYAEISPAIDSRIKTFVYSPNEIYHLTFVVNYQSYIELEKDEEVELVTLGDPNPWNLKVASRRIFIKAVDPGAMTNMMIMTNKRTYLMEISSTNVEDEGLNDKLIYVARFFYPELNPDVPRPTTNNISINAPLPDGDCRDGKCQGVMAGSENLNFRFSYAGNSERLIPLRVFDNEFQTYIQFANANDVVPDIYAVNPDGTEVLLPARRVDEYIVVNTVEYQFALRYGKELVCLFNDRLLSASKPISITLKRPKK